MQLRRNGIKAPRGAAPWSGGLMFRSQLVTRFGLPCLLSSGAATLAFAVAMPAWSQSAGAPFQRSFDIPALPLNEALRLFMQQSGIQVSYASGDGANVRTGAVRGELASAAALSQLLAGTGLTYRFTAPTSAILEPAPTADAGAVQLGAVRVEGASGNGTESYGAGYDPAESDPYAKMANPPTGVASKTPLTQREIPQSVSVVTQAEIQQTNAASLGDVMRRVPGIFVQKADSGRIGYITRGFDIDNFQIDGVPTSSSLIQNDPDLVAYDRVEVLRGPAGLLNALGSAGGAVNLVFKKPTSTFAASAIARAGSFDDYFEQLDVSGPLNAAGSLRARAAEGLSTDDTPRHGARRRNTSLYGVIEYDASPDTLLRAGISYHRLFDRDQYAGYPAYSDYTLIKGLQHVLLGSDWNRETYDTLRAYAEAEQKVGRWSLKLNANFARTQFNWLASYAQGAVDPTTNTTSALRLSAGPSEDRQLNIDAFASGPVDIPGVETTLTVGFNYLHDFVDQRNHYISSSNLLGLVPVNIFDYSAPRPDFSHGVAILRTTTTDQYGAYFNARMKPAKWLTLVAGGRLSWWQSDFDPNPNNILLNVPTHDKLGTHFTPYGGLIADIDRHHSLYASYSEIYQPQTARDTDGRLLKPLSGRQFEIGAKGEYFDGRLNASLALFQVTQANRAVTDPADPLFASHPDGKARARGVEATLSGNITPNLELNASYTYTRTRYLDPIEQAEPGEFGSDIAPRHMFRLWTNYTLPGRLSAWSLGGGITASSGTHIDDGVGRIRQGSYATFDARVAYTFSKHFEASVSVTNITDKYYYERLGGLTAGNWLGAPREAMATLRATY
jgi:outer-membrane receptor for ferric coprogen and ferric-rhodotorulic acid